MVNLMEVDWVRPRHRAGGAEPYHYWFAADIVDQMAFAATWPENPTGHFAKFRSVGTQGVLEILREIADRRTTFAVAGYDSARWQSFPVDAGLWNDTLDVVKTNPFHCGGWLGLLTVRNIAARQTTLVDRPDPDGRTHYVTWPPAPSRGLLGILGWLMQSIHIVSANTGTGNHWTANQNMLYFLRGQKATGGLESLSDTVRGLVYENADKQLLHFYLSHLRGHGPTEAGRDHHLFRMVESTGDSDAAGIALQLKLSMDAVLQAFPAAWGRTTVGHWNAEVADHVMVWLQGMGNHAPGLRWLSTMLGRRIADWNAPDVNQWIGGTRETQRTLGTTLTDTVTNSVTQVEAITTRIGLARREATTEGWTRALTESLSRIESWSSTTGGGTSNTTGGSFGNTTAVTVGGETGELEQLLLGKITGEATTTIQTQLHSQFTTHLNHEQTRGGSTNTSTSQTDTATLQRMREVSYNMSREASQSLSQTISRGRALSRSVQSVIDADGDLSRQIANVRRGLTLGKETVDAAR